MWTALVAANRMAVLNGIHRYRAPVHVHAPFVPRWRPVLIQVYHDTCEPRSREKHFSLIINQALDWLFSMRFIHLLQVQHIITTPWGMDCNTTHSPLPK